MVQVGSTAYMHCPVIHLGKREVNNLFFGGLQQIGLEFRRCGSYIYRLWVTLQTFRGS